jgi:hypothetical protein
MLKKLPFSKFLIFILFFISIFFSSSPLLNQKVHAADPTPVPATSEGSWVRDDEVTFAGKVAARSGHFLDWTLANYSWSSVAGTTNNPLADFWKRIRDIIIAFFILFVLVTAFVIIFTRGRNITFMKFIPRFIGIVLLVVFSFSIIQFIYQVMDAIQGFFLTNTKGAIISQKDLLFVGFDYKGFQGYRIFGPQFDESVFISLLLVKLTALTYYVMVGVLLLRKIILWLFIVISPVFPLLLLYSPIRNTAKIWVGEFFRWLLYGPLFAIFLSGLVHLWSSNTGIPLNFNFNKPEQYPTAISILLGGPGQIVSLQNSVNNPDTFALYVIALLMLWVVIILPFLLLQIFLDFLQEFSWSENNVVKQLIAGGSTLINRGGGGPPVPPPPGGAPLGLSKPLPFTPAKIAIPELNTKAASIPMGRAEKIQTTEKITTTTVRDITSKTSSDVMRLANLSVPTMRDIAKYETSLASTSIQGHQETAKIHEALENIANPSQVTTQVEKQKFSLINERLKEEAQRGDPLATSILTAANTVTGKKVEEDKRINTVFSALNNVESISSTSEREKLSVIKESLETASQRGDPLATSILGAVQKGKADDDIKNQLLEAKEKGNQLADSVLQAAGISEDKLVKEANFPQANRVQAVSIDDYESVKKIWQENYQKLEPPKTIDGKPKSRKDWIESDIQKISDTINLLVSQESQNIKKGMEAVGAILPFLLIGGFSQTEVVAYLKAKLEAAKVVISELEKKQQEEDTMVDASRKKEEKPKEMKMEEEAPEGEKKSHE